MNKIEKVESGDDELQRNIQSIDDEYQEKFIKVEKDLFTIGFFSAPKYRNSKSSPKQEKIVKLTSFAETDIETKAEILTHQKFGLPTTSDLTKYLAFLKIVHERYKEGNRIQNPIQFTHYELLQKANLVKNADRYEEVTTWLERLDNTQIIIYGETEDNSADERRLFKLFKEVHLSGRKNKDGDRIKFNTVWLSDWTINNICEKPLIPVDFETYQKLNNDVAKLLVVHLQVWLYASRKQKLFEKTYTKFIELLDLAKKTTKSEMNRQLSPALNELKKHEYIADWKLVPGSNGELKIQIWHGKKFKADMSKAFFNKVEENILPVNDEGDEGQEKSELQNQLVELGIYSELAKKLIEKFPVEKLKLRLAWALKELRLKEQKETVEKPGGLLYKIINSVDEPELSNWDQGSGSFEESGSDETFETDDSVLNREFEKSKWLLSNFEEFCHAKALKNKPLDFDEFSKGFRIGSKIFDEFLEEMKSKLNPQIFQSWFEHIYFAGYDEKHLYIAGSEVNRDWVITYYEKEVQEIFEKMKFPYLHLSWLVSEAVIPTDSDVDYFYKLRLIKNYQEKNQLTLDGYYEKNQKKLDKEFESYFEKVI